MACSGSGSCSEALSELGGPSSEMNIEHLYGPSLSSTARGVRPGARICSRYFSVTASGLPRARVLRDSSLFYIVLSVGADTVHGEVTLRRSLRTTSTSSGGITSFAFRLIPPAIGGRFVLMASRSIAIHDGVEFQILR